MWRLPARQATCHGAYQPCAYRPRDIVADARRMAAIYNRYIAYNSTTYVYISLRYHRAVSQAAFGRRKHPLIVLG